MIPGLKLYPACKDSRVPSLGKIPRDWQARWQRNVPRMLVSTIDKHSVEAELSVLARLHKMLPFRRCQAVKTSRSSRC